MVWYSGANLNTRRFLHADHLGSIVAVTNCSGGSECINEYDEYGIPSRDAQGVNTNSGRFQYTGQAWIDELGMYYYKARIYSPTLGRFLQTDPIGYDDQINLYAYVGNDPVDRNDPTGLETGSVTCANGACGEGSFDGYEALQGLYELSGAKDVVEFVKHPSLKTGIWAAAAVVPADRILNGGRLVIGKMFELGSLRKGEFTLSWAEKATTKANWKENYSQLREVMSANKPIRDAHVDPKTGALMDPGKGTFLAAERNALQSRGWTYNSKAQTWNPPRDACTGTRLC